MELSQFSAASLFSTYTSGTAMLTLSRQFYYQFVPELVRDYIASKVELWLKKKSRDFSESFVLIIDENYEDSYQSSNYLYEACHAYLENKIRSKATRLRGNGTNCEHYEQPSLTYRIVHGEEFVETLENVGIDVQWKFACKNAKGEDDESGANKCFELKFDLAYKNEVLDGFIPLVVLKSYYHKLEMNKQIYLYTLEGLSSWRRIKFNHPFTFDSLALEPELKKCIIDDLDMFLRRKEFYKKVGKAWKRGYLLYGPPGTGKSSLIAAMANYLKFNVYDLQLGNVDSDDNLRKLMLTSMNKSILVIEDIDCTIGLSRAPPKVYDDNDDDSSGDDMSCDEEPEEGNSNVKPKTKLSLSGVLNFIDGIWSTCGDERIIIFTTNHKERLDPAMLRPGRMDMHIHMSFLTMNGFRVLANNYIGVSGDHTLFGEIEKLLETTEVTPAQVAEELIRSEDPNIALSRVIDLLRTKSKQRQQNKNVKKKTKSVLKRGTKVMKRTLRKKKSKI